MITLHLSDEQRTMLSHILNAAGAPPHLQLNGPAPSYPAEVAGQLLDLVGNFYGVLSGHQHLGRAGEVDRDLTAVRRLYIDIALELGPPYSENHCRHLLEQKVSEVAAWLSKTEHSGEDLIPLDAGDLSVIRSCYAFLRGEVTAEVGGEQLNIEITEAASLEDEIEELLGTHTTLTRTEQELLPVYVLLSSVEQLLTCPLEPALDAARTDAVAQTGLQISQFGRLLRKLSPQQGHSAPA